MCIRLVGVDLKEKSVVEKLGMPPSNAQEILPDCFPGDLDIALRQRDGQRELFIAQWGLQPPWATDPRFGKKNAYNARAETVAEKPTFRSALRYRRCVIPVAAYYERNDGNWLMVSPVDRPCFLLAGLWEHGSEYSPVETFTVITTEPNDKISPVHDRMPVLLDDVAVGLWISDENRVSEIIGLLQPSPSEWVALQDAGPIRTKPQPNLEV